MAYSNLWRRSLVEVRRCAGCGASVLTQRARASSEISTPRRIVLLSKTTRLEYLRWRLSEENQQDWVSYIGSVEYKKLEAHHNHHYESVDVIESFLRSRGLEVRLRDSCSYSDEDVGWSDAIFSAGGDGTFLCASSRVFSPSKLVVGFNTDIEASEGFLCFNSGHSYSSLLESLQALFRQEVPLYRRSRIRVEKGGVTLPVRALNEVFIGENNPSHASYYELNIDGSLIERQKSSGLLIYTSTGSTSWAYNVHTVREKEVEKILRLYQERAEDQSLIGSDAITQLSSQITKAYNQGVVSPGNHPGLSYTVREPINRGIFQAQHLNGTALSVSVKSLTWHTQLIMDGNYTSDMGGQRATCTINPQDNLTTLYHST